MMGLNRMMILFLSTLFSRTTTQIKANSKIPTFDCVFNELENVECLVCKIPKNEIVSKMTWQHNDNPFSYGQKLISKTDGRMNISITRYRELKITIKNIKKEDAGYYQCGLDYGKEPIIRYKLILYDKPKITAHSNTTMVVLQGKTAELWCNATSLVPMDEYNTSWYIYNSTTDNSMTIGIIGSKLEIVNITRHCMATYRCTVKNKKGATNMNFDVIVHAKPDLKVEIQMNGEETSFNKNNVKIPLNTNVVMKCLVLSKPEVTSMEWYRNKILIGKWNQTLNTKTEDSFKQKYSLMKEHRQKDDISTFVLKFTSSDQDFSPFVCSASNSIGTSLIETTLTL